MENINQVDQEKESPLFNKQLSPEIKQEDKEISIMAIFNLLSCLKREIKQSLNLETEQESILLVSSSLLVSFMRLRILVVRQLSQTTQNKLIASLKTSYQNQLELYYQQASLYNQISSSKSIKKSSGQAPNSSFIPSDLDMSYGGHRSNPNNPLFPGTLPSPQIEEAKDVLIDIPGANQVLTAVIFQIRESPAAALDFFNALTLWRGGELAKDQRFMEQLALFFFDNPFRDTFQTADTNLQYFTLLKAVYNFLNQNATKDAPTLDRNSVATQSQPQNSTPEAFIPVIQLLSVQDIDRYRLLVNTFQGLTMTTEAQSYIRFLYRNVFSKINLNQLMVLYVEQKTNLEKLRELRERQHIAQQLKQPLPSQGQHTNQAVKASMQQQQYYSSSRDAQGRNEPTVSQTSSHNAKYQSMIDFDDSRKLKAKSDIKKAEVEELKKEPVKQKKQGMLSKLFRGKDKEREREKHIERERKKALQQQHLKMRETYDQKPNYQSLIDYGKDMDDSTIIDRKSAASRAQRFEVNHKRDHSQINVKASQGSRLNLSNDQPPQYFKIDHNPQTKLDFVNQKGSQEYSLSPSNLRRQEDSYFDREDEDRLDKQDEYTLNDLATELSHAAINTNDHTSYGYENETNASGLHLNKQQSESNNQQQDKQNQYKFNIKSYDLTGYLLQILIKISECIYTSVWQIPHPIRTFLKILADSIIKSKPDISKVELYRMLNYLLIEKWLSQCFQIPEMYGILPKPNDFKEQAQSIFFSTAQLVLNQIFRMSTIDKVAKSFDFFNIPHINEFIIYQIDNVMIFFDVLLNIDVSVYSQQSLCKEKSLVESVLLKLDSFKKLIKLIRANVDSLKQHDPNMEELLDKMMMRLESSLDGMLDDNFGEVKINIEESLKDHFDSRNEDSLALNDSQLNQSVSLQSRVKFIMFYRIKETLSSRAFHVLQQILDYETNNFLEKNSISSLDAMGTKYKQLIRNLTELMTMDEVQFPSIQHVVREKHYDLGNDLSTLLLTLIRADECSSLAREGADKDKLRIQCMIICRNLQQLGIEGNNKMQAKLLKHLINRTIIRIQNLQYDLSPIPVDNHLRESTSSTIQSKAQSQQVLSTGYEKLKMMLTCFSEDLQYYQNQVKIEKDYCNKIQQSLLITHIIQNVKPFVCLDFDSNRYGFSLERQDKCDKHVANPLLTGQLLFGIVQTNTTPSGNQANNGGGGQGTNRQGAGARGTNQHTTSSIAFSSSLASSTLGGASVIHQANHQTQIAALPRRTKHYMLKRIDYFMIALQNKFKGEFRTLISQRATTGGKQDFMNLKGTYESFLEVIKNLLMSNPYLAKNLNEAQKEINEYICRQMHRSIFVLIEPSLIDIEIQRAIQRNSFSFESLEFPQELKDEILWVDAIEAFDKFSREETPMEKLQVVARTSSICAHIFHMAMLKDKEMASDDELDIMTYVISKSVSAFKLHSNYQFIRLFNVSLPNGSALERALILLGSVVALILEKAQPLK